MILMFEVISALFFISLISLMICYFWFVRPKAIELKKGKAPEYSGWDLNDYWAVKEHAIKSQNNKLISQLKLFNLSLILIFLSVVLFLFGWLSVLIISGVKGNITV